MKNMGKVRIAINGFGRIGRAIAKINAQYKYFDLALINDINPHVDNLAYLLRYDSTYGKFNGRVENSKNEIVINGSAATCTAYRNMQDAPWEDYGVNIVIDSSGIEKQLSETKRIINNGKVGNVIVTNSSKEVDHEVIMGVNDETLTADHKVVSSSICDANAISHVLKWVNDGYGIEGGALTTLHPWLSYQNLVDGPAVSQGNPGVVWADYALGRASVGSLIPKNTTAIRAAERALPDLQGRILSFSYRVPTDIVSSSDMTLFLGRTVNEQEFKQYLKNKCKDSYYVKINEESLISSDYEQEEASAVIDMQWVKVNGNVIKLILWYDNEWGYSARVLDLAKKLSGI